MKVVALIFVVVVMCGAEETKVTLCGRQLSEARVLVCFGSEYVNKRDSEPLLLSDFDDKNLEDWPWSGRRAALSASWSRYKRQGIVNECCFKPCATSEILNYC